MNYDIVQAEYIDGFRLKLTFADGVSGEVDLSPMIGKGGVFAPLQDINAFKRFSIDPEWKTISWQNGELDLAPEPLYYEAVGRWPEEISAQVAEESPTYGSSGNQ